MHAILLMPSTRKRMTHLYNFAGNFIYAKSGSTPKNHYLCDQLAINLFTRSVRISILILFSLNLTAIVPLYNLFFKSDSVGYEQKFIIEFLLPFIDPTTQRGFYINFVNQSIICMIGVVGLPYIEVVTCFMMNNITVSAAVIANDLEEFGAGIKNVDQSSAEFNWKFKNIIVQMMDYDRFSASKFYLREMIRSFS